jgi:putative membrane protein (TIGR04086 family)
MNVRWGAVLAGVAVDLTLTLLLQGVALLLGAQPSDDIFSFQRTTDIVLIALGLLATCAGGFVAGAVARDAGLLNGLMVGVVDILIFAVQRIDPVGTTGARFSVLFQLVGCLAGALGGYLSRYRTATR